jgi:hypothetical protein
MVEAFLTLEEAAPLPRAASHPVSQHRSGYEEVSEMEKCTVCGEEFETEEALLKHNSEVHSAVHPEAEDAEKQPEAEESQRR